MVKFLKKYWKNILGILWWIFYLNSGRYLLTGEGWGKDGESAIRGVLLILYPLTLFHLNSAIKTGELFLLKKEQEASLTEAQKTFFSLTTLVSGLTFIFLNIMHLIAYLLWVYLQVNRWNAN